MRVHISIYITYLHKLHFGVLYVTLITNIWPEAEFLVGGFCVLFIPVSRVWHTGST